MFVKCLLLKSADFCALHAGNLRKKKCASGEWFNLLGMLGVVVLVMRRRNVIRAILLADPKGLMNLVFWLGLTA